MTQPTATPQADPAVNQILLKLGEMSAQLAVIVEQLKAVPDHEARIRANEARIPENLSSRLSALEKWRYGLPFAGVLAFASLVISAYGWLRK